MTGYDIAPWALPWRGFDLDWLKRTESTLALSNGHIGLRGTLEEGEPRALPGTYLNGFFEHHPLPYAERGYGNPEDGQTVINVTDGKIIRLLVGDEPLDLRYGHISRHERTLDFRSGTLRRTTEWTSPTGRRIRLDTERLVSFTQRAVVAIRYEVRPLDEDTQLVVQSDLLANEPIDDGYPDPRVASVLDRPLIADFAASGDHHAVLAHHAHRSGLRMAAAMDHEIETSGELRSEIHAEGDLARLTFATKVAAGEVLRLSKYVGYGWSARRSVPALRSQVDAALAGARQTGWEGLLREQRHYLDQFWNGADIELHGDAELQQATRFALFHVLQAGARGETRAIPGKGLTGPGYEGHAFWDSETFVLPVLTYTMPAAARDALRWRHNTLDKAQDRAAQLGLAGAAFPWRSIDGAECSAYWPAGTAAFHVCADIADATARYTAATGDEDFDTNQGTELLVETARLWCSLGHHDRRGAFRIQGVTGPDEYTAVVNNNLYTNLMAQRNLRQARAACARNPQLACALGVTDAELGAWHAAAEHMLIPFDADIGVHEQCSGFTTKGEWNFEAIPPQNYPLLLNYPYFDLYRKQVVKQADTVLAMHLRGDAFTQQQKVSNFAYYEARTVRDSSLSACTQSVLAAEVGDLDLAYDYFAETGLTDLHDLHNNVRNGLHIAALAGTWISAVAGFGGMRDHDGELAFAPRLPETLDRLSFRMCFCSSLFEVAISPETTTYRLISGPTLETSHHDEPIQLVAGKTVTKPNPPTKPPDEILRQPPGRQPRRRCGS